MKIVWLVVCTVVTYLSFAPVPITPSYWSAPSNKGLVGDFAENSALTALSSINIDGQLGPEDFAIDDSGVIATSSHSGYILRKKPEDKSFERWINTGGRPLGLEYDKSGNLLIADAFLGLLKANPKGEITVLSNSVDGTPIVFADDVDVASNGIIYFTDATTKFSAKQYGGTLQASMLEIFEHQGNGRLLAFDPNTSHTEILIDGLVFANGVAVSHDERSVLVNETGNYRILRYYLNGDKKGSVDVFLDNLPGFPDNISATGSNEYFIGLASERSALVDALAATPMLRAMIQRLPQFFRPTASAYGHLIKVNESGKITLNAQDPHGNFSFVTGAIETNDGIYVSSLTANAVGFLKKKEDEAF